MKIRFQVPEAGDPRREGGMQLPDQQSKRVAPRWRWLFIMALGLSPALIVGGFFLHGWLWLEAGGFVLLDETRITAAQAGTVRAIQVKNGTQVAAGATLLDLEDGALRAELDALRGARDQGPRGDEAALDRQIEAARDRLRAHERLERTIGALHDEGAATQGELLAAAARTAAAEGELASLERERARERDAAARRRRASPELASRMAVLEEQLRGLRVRAPVDGTVDGLSVSKGQNVGPGEPLLVIRRGEPRIVGFLQGRELALKPGETVRVDLPDGRTVKGKVVGQAPSTLRLPEELSGSFDQRTPRLQIAIAAELPPEARVHRLPVTVRVFRFRL